MRHALVALTLAACGVPAAAPDASPAPPPAAVTYVIVLGSQPGIEVTIDGVPVHDDFLATYATVSEATASPLFHLATPSDAIDMGFGACLDAAPSDVIAEIAPAYFDASGMFLGGATDPRAWRNVGCLRCAFADGTTSVECT